MHQEGNGRRRRARAQASKCAPDSRVHCRSVGFFCVAARRSRQRAAAPKTRGLPECVGQSTSTRSWLRPQMPYETSDTMPRWSPSGCPLCRFLNQRKKKKAAPKRRKKNAKKKRKSLRLMTALTIGDLLESVGRVRLSWRPACAFLQIVPHLFQRNMAGARQKIDEHPAIPCKNDDDKKASKKKSQHVTCYRVKVRGTRRWSASHRQQPGRATARAIETVLCNTPRPREAPMRAWNPTGKRAGPLQHRPA